MENNFKMSASNNVVVICDAKTLLGAKREASKWMSYDGGSVYVHAPDGDIWKREFWKSGKHFGWEGWHRIED